MTSQDDIETGILVSCYCLGALGGCILNFFTGDYLGRRKAMWMAMGFVLVGATLQTSAFTRAHLIVGRVVTGFGTGIDSSTVPMYQSELCRKEVRGRLVSWEVLFIGIGISFAILARLWHELHQWICRLAFPDRCTTHLRYLRDSVAVWAARIPTMAVQKGSRTGSYRSPLPSVRSPR